MMENQWEPPLGVGQQHNFQPYMQILASSDRKPMPKEVAEAVIKVMDKVGYVQKKGTNTFHNYKFAAIGDLLAKLQPAMVEAGLVIVQNELRHGVVHDNICEAEYEFTLSSKEGVTWEERPKHTGWSTLRNTKGGIDDKALNKCFTAAGKYFVIGLFKIPTGDAVDPDEEEDAAPPRSPPAATRAPTPVSRGGTKVTPPPSSRDAQGQDEDPNGWRIWMPGFLEEMAQQGSELAGREYWKDHDEIIKNMKATRPDLYAELVQKAAAISEALPKDPV